MNQRTVILVHVLVMGGALVVMVLGISLSALVYFLHGSATLPVRDSIGMTGSVDGAVLAAILLALFLTMPGLVFAAASGSLKKVRASHTVNRASR